MELLFVVDTTRLLISAPLFLNKQSVASQPSIVSLMHRSPLTLALTLHVRWSLPASPAAPGSEVHPGRGVNCAGHDRGFNNLKRAAAESREPSCDALVHHESPAVPSTKQTPPSPPLSVQKAREKRSLEDMARVLQKNKANMKAASKQKKTRIPTKQVQYQTCTCGQQKHSDRFTRAGWKSHGTCRACQAKKQELMAFEPDASDSLIVTLDSWGVLKGFRIAVFCINLKRFPYFRFSY